jgi:hypothetical protein
MIAWYALRKSRGSLSEVVVGACSQSLLTNRECRHKRLRFTTKASAQKSDRKQKRFEEFAIFQDFAEQWSLVEVQLAKKVAYLRGRVDEVAMRTDDLRVSHGTPRAALGLLNAPEARGQCNERGYILIHSQ